MTYDFVRIATITRRRFTGQRQRPGYAKKLMNLGDYRILRNRSVSAAVSACRGIISNGRRNRSSQLNTTTPGTDHRANNTFVITNLLIEHID